MNSKGKSGRSERRRPSRQEIRKQLLEAAGTVFAHRGYERASLDEVAEVAGWTKGAVYSNFASKQDLFLALMRHRVEERIDAVRRVTPAGEDAQAQAAAAGAALTTLLRDQRDWHLLFIEFWGQAVREPAVREVFVEHRRQLRALIADFFAEAAAALEVEVPLPTDQLATLALALSNGVAIEHLADPDTVDANLMQTGFEFMFGRAGPA
jgi:AcrR family transcriptional regulator